MKKLTITVALLLVIILTQWQPWERQPVVFYEPIIYPIEVLRGDIIVTPDGDQLVMQHNMRIKDIKYHNGSATINSTRYITLWEYLSEK